MPLKDREARRAYHRTYFRKWYAANREKHLAYVGKVNARRTKSIAVFISWLKELPCADCRRQLPPECMDFDHVRGTKIGSISSAAWARWPIQRVMDEIQKCEVVCAVCHRTRTMNRQKSMEDAR